MAAIATFALAFAACVPVTVNVTFPQEKLESAAARRERSSLGPASIESLAFELENT